MLRNGVFAVGNGLENGGLSTSVLTQQTVTATEVQLEGGVGDEDLAVEHKRSGSNLNVARGSEGGKHTGGDTIGQTVLVHLCSELLNLLHLLVGGSGLLASLDILLASLLALLVGRLGALGHTGSLRGGNHIGGYEWEEEIMWVCGRRGVRGGG